MPGIPETKIILKDILNHFPVARIVVKEIKKTLNWNEYGPNF